MSFSGIHPVPAEVPVYATVASLPTSAAAGSLAVTLDTNYLYEFNGTSWVVLANGASGGTVTSVSVVNANGLNGSVANPTTTPAITLSTTITGILKGNGTAISAAVAGTDYQAAGSYITALTGDVAAAGPGSVTATIANNAVTNSKLAQMPANTIKGNNTGSPANAIDLTTAQATAMLNQFTSSLQGVVPASGGGTTNFLRADGTWAPASGGSGTVTTVSVVTANGLAGSVANPTTTPAITLSTTVTGLLKGNGTAISAAVAGTDYQAAGDYITGLVGDVTANGPGIVTATIPAASITTAKLASGAVTNSILANMAAQTVKANTTGGSASPTDVSLGTVTEATSSVLTLSGWAYATLGSPTIQVKQATTSQAGYLSATDWNTFNGKQPAGDYITGLTGDGTASGPGIVAFTLGPTVSGAKTFSTSITTPALISSSANAASAGAVRLASTDVINWRNNANSGDISLSKNSSDQLLFNGSKIATVPTSTIRLQGTNGYGSTNTMIPRWANTTVGNGGSDITYTDSATNGGSFTINTPGTYVISLQLSFSGTSGKFGITVNDTQMTTVWSSMTQYAEQLMGSTTAGAGQSDCVSVPYVAAASDVIRAHTEGNGLSTENFRTMFTIVRIN